MNDNILSEETTSKKVQLSIQIDAELAEQIKNLTNEPSRVVENAIKEWLKGEKRQDDDLTRRFHRNPPVPPRGEWND